MDDSGRGFWSTLSKTFRGLGTDPSLHASSSSASNTICSVFKDLPRKINEDVYEIRTPATKPSLEIIFFHGFEIGDYRDAYWTDWLSADRSQCWLETWLVQELPDARVLSVSYDSSLGQGSTFGRADLHIVAENLVSSLIKSADAKVGQDNCPVILVGHSLGGIVIKKLMVTAAKSVRDRDEDGLVIKNFFSKVKGLFFYSTPHSGSILAKAIRDSGKGQLIKDLEIFGKDLARLDEDFHILRSRFQWKVHGVGELHETELDGFHGVVVEEGSARHGMLGNYNTIPADHINICKPDGKKSHSFRILLEFIESIIHEAIVPLHQCQGLPEYPVNVEGRARKIQEKLIAEQVLGIVGMGGIGKTTLAKEVFNNISGKFEYTCFVDHVKGMQIHALDDWLLSQFHRNGSRVDRPKAQWPDLKDKKTLIVMDDVESVEQLRILPKLGHFGEGSRLIITTRDKSVLKAYDSYEVGFLRKDDATKLFCSHMFRQEEVCASIVGRHQPMKYVQTVIEKCGGLPLTLEVLGRYLRGHENDANFWEETISKLGKAQAITGVRDDSLWAKLRVSCDALITEEKEMFVGAATFFFGEPLERALAAWSTACGESETRWANLLNRCLVKEVWQSRFGEGMEDFQYYKAVWVHEQLRDLAKNLSPGNMVYASGAKNADDFVKLINANRVEETQFLHLSYPNVPLGLDLEGKRRRVLHLVSLFSLKQLKYLELNGVYLKGSRKNIPRNISLLRWIGPQEEWFPICCLEEMKNLAVLELVRWKTSKEFPEALEKLNNLRILSLVAMETLDHLPEDFGRLPRLKDLKLDSVSLSALPESFGNLPKLERLTFINVELAELPQSFGNLSFLVHLIFADVGFTKLPESFGNLSSLQTLRFTNVQLTELPESFGNLSSLAHLSFKDSQLTELPESFGTLSSLEHLTFTNAFNKSGNPGSFDDHSLPLEQLSLEAVQSMGSQLTELPESFANLSSLKHLIFSNVQLAELPHSFGNLSSLEQLTFKDVPLEELPQSFGSLSSLKHLIFDNVQLIELVESFGNLSSLVTLKFQSCKMLVSLHDSFATKLSSLQALDIQLCPLFNRLPHSLGQLSGLQELRVWCGLEELGEWFGELSGLKVLDLRCSSLERLPVSFGLLSSLEILQLSGDIWMSSYDEGFKNQCGKLKSLPENFGNLKALRKLTISQAELRRLPFTFRLLTSLQELTISAPCLETLAGHLGQFESMKELDLKVGTVKALPVSVGQLSSLRKLRFVSRNAETLPENLGQLASLETMKLKVGRVKALPEGLGQLASLRALIIDCWDMEEELPDDLGQLSLLQDFHICARGVVNLPEILGRLSSLRRLTINYCDKLESLPESLGRLSTLQEVRLYCCQKLRSLPVSLGTFSPEEDRNTNETIASRLRKGMRLYVDLCPLLNDSMLSSLGWVRVPDGFLIENRYRRKGPDEDNGCLLSPGEVQSMIYLGDREYGLPSMYFSTKVRRDGSRRVISLSL